ncbi:MAG: ParB/RepB/Spo0J family partition protein [Clostridia bacterium]|nr:ParB/RepB/Spo0J family partition protein [Clostridia bacterium]
MKTKEEKREKSIEKSRVQVVQMIGVDDIVPNPAQPRRFFTDDAILRLADSIRIHGIIQPLCIRRHDMNTGVYELVAGERRLRAAKRLGMKEVPCITVDADSEQSAHMAIVENIQRENLNMFEQAEAIKKLMDVHCLTQEKIAEKLSCSQSYVANKMRLLRFPDEEREDILAAGLSERHARALLRLRDAETRRSALNTVVRREMNVASTEEYIDRLIETEKREKARERDERRTKLVIKDVKLLYNTIDRAVETVRLSGIDVQTLRRENARDTEIVIRIPKYA